MKIRPEMKMILIQKMTILVKRIPRYTFSLIFSAHKIKFWNAAKAATIVSSPGVEQENIRQICVLLK